MTTLRYGVAGAVLFLAVLVAARNWYRLCRPRSRPRGQDTETVPLLSIGLTAFAAWVHPGEGKSWMLLVPLLDIATWLVVILPFWIMLKALFPIRRKTASGPVEPLDRRNGLP